MTGEAFSRWSEFRHDASRFHTPQKHDILDEILNAKPSLRILIGSARGLAQFQRRECAMKRHIRELLRFSAVAVALLVATSATAQTATRCVIAAANKAEFSYSTATVTGCKINERSGQTSYRIKGKERKRSYTGTMKMSQDHINAATYWLRRAERFDVTPNPANFRIRHFLQQAAKADRGIVLVRDRKGKKALTVVYLTDGVYRSIDFKGTDLMQTPFGFLTTAALN
ncbi:MAG: hypothetical protein HKN63_01315 [Rhodobacteraceae bacterium]|nr:hypothetical protein [Paracoccaceae bacterium]